MDAIDQDFFLEVNLSSRTAAPGHEVSKFLKPPTRYGLYTAGWTVQVRRCRLGG